jgi:hypothetical protein
MRNIIYGSFLLLSCSAFVIFFAGCDTTTTNTLGQLVDEIAWLPDESGMIAYVDKTTYNSLDGSTTEGANLYHVGSNGSLGNSINGNDVGIIWGGYGPVVYVSSNGQTAITQFGSDIYTVPISSGNITDIIRSTALLGVSLDGKYAATNISSNGAAAIFTIYDLSSTPPTPSPAKTIPRLLSNRVLWLNNDHYAVTILDSLGADQQPFSHVTIFDVNGDSLMAFPNGDVSFHASAYSPGSNDLFVRTHNMGIDRINLTTLTRTSIVTTDSVESMDASSDGSILVYSSADSATQYILYAVNVATLHSQAVASASNIIVPILSPKFDRVACIHKIDGNNTDIQVFSVPKP